MVTTVPSQPGVPSNIFPDDPASEKLRQLVERAGDLLPTQGPLTGFAFLNPLQGLEHLRFEDGMAQSARLFGCYPYLAKDAYREKLASGRIELKDLQAVMRDEMGAFADMPIRPSGTRFDLRMAMLQYPLRTAPAEELRWFIAEADALTHFGEEIPGASRNRFLDETRQWVMRDVLSGAVAERADLTARSGDQIVEALLDRFDKGAIESWDERTWERFSLQLLWRVCRAGIEQVEIPPPPGSQLVRHRDLLFELSGRDIDLMVHPVLTRFCAAYTDQGISNWALPDRDAGLFQSFCTLYRTGRGLAERWLRPLARELDRIQAEKITPMASLQESLRILGVAEAEWSEYIEATLLALRGWAGMIWQMEVREDRVARATARGSLIEFVAVRLLLERAALQTVCRSLKFIDCLDLEKLREIARRRKSSHSESAVEQRIFFVFQLAQVMNWSPRSLHDLTAKEWAALVTEIESFPALSRRRTFHLAYEHRLLVQSLDAIAVRTQQPAPPVVNPRFQSVYCIDAREESFRRHLEEQRSGMQTFSAAGFFGVAMYFRGIADAHFSAQCPVVVRPKHWVIEDMAFPFEEAHQFRSRSRRALGIAAHQIHLDSRSLGPGAVLSAGLGTLASIPLVMRILFPELTAKIRRAFGKFVEPPMMTHLRLERTLPTAGPQEGQVGFSVDEMADLSERFLRDIGLTSGFARLIFFIGHGSACQNNPHKSTYDCGACTGNPGGPNGRVLAAMLNHPKVRSLLVTRGLAITDATHFIGGLHNTCDDTVMFYDLDQLPKTHFEDFEAARRTFDVACHRNSHERCRRFYSAPLDLTPEAAHRHVKDRSEDLAQTRPEFGNASNALCIVGRRSRSIGLYLDRRCFLQSYDPTQDDEDYSILDRILAAVVPVCTGISMQYYLSAVDTQGWGSGTKLPHNVTSLLGVMDGAASDLRCGLPSQSTEIHEPVRLLFVLETTPEGILQIMERNPTIGRILGNGWGQLAVLDPYSDRIQVYVNGKFRPYEQTITDLPKAISSLEWYRGWRAHLPFAIIDPDAMPTRK